MKRGAQTRARRPSARPRGVDLYHVLQVDARAHPDVIRAAYRVLARQYHPDRNPSAGAAQTMRRVNAAYEVLSQAESRARYDAYCARVAARDARREAQPAAYQSPAVAAPIVPAGLGLPVPERRLVIGLGAVLLLFLVLLATWLVGVAMDDGLADGGSKIYAARSIAAAPATVVVAPLKFAARSTDSQLWAH